MPKRLIICADGTWNQPDQSTRAGQPCPTNVVKIAAATLPRDEQGNVQVVYYHKGVGRRSGLLDRLVGGAFGGGISLNIIETYLFLVTNYDPEDELFFLGFSRGAYTVRSLAGLIGNCGILRRRHVTKYTRAYELYRDRTLHTRPSSETARMFRRQYSWPASRIKFIGVWDTVGALGIPITPLQRLTRIVSHEFHDVRLSRNVDHAYQALALDERRTAFAPALWTKQRKAPPEQVLEQVWFPGCHCDVGGGSALSGLSDCALAWMWRRAVACGLALDEEQRPQPDPTSAIEEFMPWYHRLLGFSPRTVGTTNPQGEERLHRAALERQARVRTYGPPNLQSFLKSSPHHVAPYDVDGHPVPPPQS